MQNKLLLCPLVGVWSIATSMFVCLSVCLVAYLKSKTSKLHEIFYRCSMEYVMYFRFCGWRHVSPQWTLWQHLREHRAEASIVKITNVFPRWRHTVWLCRRTQGQQTVHLGEVRCPQLPCVITAILSVGWLEFNVPFHHKYVYIRDDGNSICSSGSQLHFWIVSKRFRGVKNGFDH